MRTFKKLLLLSILTFCVTAGYTQRIRPVEYGGFVNLVSENDGMLKVRVMGYGKNEATAREDAEIRVLRATLYVGFPAKYSLKALITNESEAEAKNPDYFTLLFDNKAYKNFITSAISVGGLDKVKGEKVKSMPFDVEINRKALERELQQNKVIAKFGVY